MHVNQQVREAAKEALEGTSLLSIFTNSSADIEHAELPAAVISTSTDEVEETSKDGIEERSINLVIVGVLEGESNTIDEDLDNLRVEVEKAIATGLGSVAKIVEHTGGEQDLVEEGNRWFAFYALSWRVVVWTETGDPETAL